jgi:hypothetical protein
LVRKSSVKGEIAWLELVMSTFKRWHLLPATVWTDRPTFGQSRQTGITFDHFNAAGRWSMRLIFPDRVSERCFQMPRSC